MSPESSHYFETQLPLSASPIAVAAHLARREAHGDYVVYENRGTWTYAGGARAELVLDHRGGRLTQEGQETLSLPWSDRPLDLVRKLLGELRIPQWRAYGWAAFELSYALARNEIPTGPGTLMHLIVPRAEVRLTTGHARVRAVDQPTMAGLLGSLACVHTPREREARPIDVRAVGEDAYREAVKLAVEEINAGEYHKVILSRVVDVEEPIDLVGTYLTGRAGNNPARSFLLQLDGLEAAGFSPEIVVKVDPAGHVVSQPLAGTRALSPDLAVNQALRDDLFGSAKEVYEHAISVKVGTDELQEVCEPGTIDVPEFMTIRERGSVQHLASQVRGRLSEGRDCWDGFGAVFPAVTASGVPKPQAYESIREHESEPRGLYAGSVMSLDHEGNLDAALVLRSVYRRGDRTWLRAGAGIVGQSEPEREFEETCEKLDSVARFLVPAEGSGQEAELPRQFAGIGHFAGVDAP